MCCTFGDFRKELRSGYTATANKEGRSSLVCPCRGDIRRNRVAQERYDSPPAIVRLDINKFFPEDFLHILSTVHTFAKLLHLIPKIQCLFQSLSHSKLPMARLSRSRPLDLARGHQVRGLITFEYPKVNALQRGLDGVKMPFSKLSKSAIDISIVLGLMG